MTEERYKLEDEIRELAKQCKCYSYNGPCRFCQRMEKLERKVDKIEAEEHTVKEVVEWLKSEKFLSFTNHELLTAIIYGLQTNAWKKEPTPL
jgi:hypothetical protein